MAAEVLTPAIKLYACPHGCPLVSHLALEYVRANFTYEFVDVLNGKQFEPEYLAISHRGKIPALVSGHERVLENVAILLWISHRFPDAKLLPKPDASSFIAAVSDLSWFSSGIHPIMSRVIRPEMFVPAGVDPENVRSVAMQSLAKEFAIIDRKLIGREFWGDEFGALDFYIFWIWARTGESNFDLSSYEVYRQHVVRMMSLPFVRRVLERERAIMPCFDGLPY